MAIQKELSKILYQKLFRNLDKSLETNLNSNSNSNSEYIYLMTHPKRILLRNFSNRVWQVVNKVM